MANKRRLIDANALEGEAICLYAYGGAKYVPLAALKRAHTVDAVEVVRCGQCRYGEAIEDSLFLCHYEGMTRNPVDHFCSYGERREDT